MNILPIIRARRSIRRFAKQTISKSAINRILEAGQWAPSGLNNQPWRFMVLAGAQKDLIAGFTKYSYIIKSADKTILVFLDKKSSYNYEKDLLAIGACIQNMLLYIHSINLGACWLGEILNQRDEVNKFLKIPFYFQLEAVIALGKPVFLPKSGKRKEMSKLLLDKILNIDKKKIVGI